MSTNTDLAFIPQEVAVALCEQIRAENVKKPWSAAAWQCWGCIKFSNGATNKMCFAGAPGQRGCQLVNQRYDQSLREETYQ